MLILDEIHLLGADRGPILEVIVSRMRYIAAQVRRHWFWVGWQMGGWLAGGQVGGGTEGTSRFCLRRGGVQLGGCCVVAPAV